MGKIHQPCPDCGSSDALQINDNGSTFCHSCHKYTPSSKVSEETWNISVPVSTEPKAKPDFSAVERTLTTGNYQAIVDRGLTTATAKTYGILDQADRTYFAYHDPSDANVPIAAKVRLPDKNFYNVGNWKDTVYSANNYSMAVLSTSPSVKVNLMPQPHIRCKVVSTHASVLRMVQEVR